MTTFVSVTRRVRTRLAAAGIAGAALVTGLAGITAAGSPAAASTLKSAPVLLVHGFDGGDILHGDLPLDGKVDCHDPVITAWKNGLKARGFTNVLTVGWYAGDINCNVYVPGRSNNTVQTSITEIGKELAKLVVARYPNQNIAISAHSLGGLITRRAVQALQNNEVTNASLARVADVVSSGAPFAGANPAILCGVIQVITQCTQAAPGSAFLAGLANNPQAVGGTDWTLVGSECDLTVSAASATTMSRVSTARPAITKVIFTAPSIFSGGCLAAAGISHSDLVTKSGPLNVIASGITTSA